MTRLPKSITLLAAAVAMSASLAACGEQRIEVAKSSPERPAAQVFKERCAGCHTFKVAAARGSATNIRTRERTDGPNFDVRHECVERVLYAIQNGGFSGAIMPANIVVGEQAREVAEFVAKYAGRDAGKRPDGYGDESNGYRCTTETPESSDPSEQFPEASGDADSGGGE